MLNELLLYEMIDDHQAVLTSKIFQQSDAFPHHGDVSCMAHALFVAYTIYRICNFLNWASHQVVRGALLHDLYLYDWHIGHPDATGRIKLHGIRHPKIALQNVKAVFDVDDELSNMILSHMWPLTPLAIPRYKSALLLCAVDKYCAVVESVSSKHRHQALSLRAAVLKNLQL